MDRFAPAIDRHYTNDAWPETIVCADIRQMFERRRWTFRNLVRMNHLLMLVRLHIDGQGNANDWTQVIEEDLAQAWRQSPSRSDGTLDFRRSRTKARRLADPTAFHPDGSGLYSRREHAVALRV
ncbi:MAG: hypothetical protein ACRDY3_08080 [Acidimicrobiales bacterium]